ncbi:sigma-54-dependent transcriptional regulator, partial [Thermodesulfobacteriota bacterium]
MRENQKILIVDGQDEARESYQRLLEDEYDLLLAATGKEAIRNLSKNRVRLILIDLLLPDFSGLEILQKLKKSIPSAEIIIVTALNEIEAVVKAMKSGAQEYMLKPFTAEEIPTTINRVLHQSHEKNEAEQPFEQMIGRDKVMRKIFDLITNISQCDGTVLILGESGTGKELVANAIHNLSLRKNEPFVIINCAAIPSTLMESQTFGHIRGAFTGATRTNIGKLEIADKGTIFLDDIDSLDIQMQAKLLRFIQEKEFERVGSNHVIKVDTRIIAASNKNLKEMMAYGEFREDLFHRLNVFPIFLPPLRERKGDIPLLVDHFLNRNAKKYDRPIKKISGRAIRFLKDCEWPGNVRELQNLVERLFILSKGHVIHLDDISVHASLSTNRTTEVPLKEAVYDYERKIIHRTLEEMNGNKKKAAEKLGIHRNT